MPEKAQTELQQKAAEFIAARGALQSAAGLAVVAASPVNMARVAALNKRAVMVQQTIESVGRMVDGARRWFADTFGIQLESSVPIAETAVDASVQTAIAGMNYFIRDVRAELTRINALDQQYQAMPPEQRDRALGELRSQKPALPSAPFPIAKKWLVAGAVLALGALWFFRKGDYESEA